MCVFVLSAAHVSVCPHRLVFFDASLWGMPQRWQASKPGGLLAKTIKRFPGVTVR